MGMTQTATTLPGNLQQLLLRFWEVVGMVENESHHASEQGPQLLPLFDVPLRPDLDKQCRGANNDRHSCQSGCGVPISLGAGYSQRGSAVKEKAHEDEGVGAPFTRVWNAASFSLTAVSASPRK